MATFKWTRTAHFSRSSDGRKWRIAKYERGWEEWLDWDTDPQQKQDCPRYTDDLGEALRLAAEFEAERKVYATQEPPPAREAAPGAGAGDNTKTSEDS